jgi:hypothetical protein
MSSEILDAYWAAPPMARTLATAIVVTSISVHFGLLSYAWFYFTEDRLFRLPPEIWRLATNFFLSGAQMGIIMDPYFAYQYLKQLEMANSKFPRKEDVLWYLMTVGSFIIVGPSHSSLFSLSTQHTSYICPHGALFLNHCGSWKRGRLPPYVDRPVIRKISKGRSGCGNGGMSYG